MIKLISLHIAKTAGTAFFGLLGREYGSQLDHRFKRIHYFPDGIERQLDSADFASETTVVHGHLYFSHISRIYQQNQPRLICWLRQPVDRVISNYYFMHRAINGRPDHPHAFKKNYSLMDYAEDSIHNKMCTYLEGISLEKLDFVGFQENFQQDVIALAKLLNWEKPLLIEAVNQRSYENDNIFYPTSFGQITQEMRSEIARINALDMALFAEAEELKRKGYWEQKSLK
ncbi:MAG: sulfotransferase family protein [Bacteroidetes bacterium]|nr:sulfotransferase family 2 domain-containing protein [Bacteroidales bacterium]MBU1008900.1 sulfotransferase family protein [Bacteroidota bacterium]